ncbi:hypothetical protein FMUND_12859 [Fusarium mundagurra]|uniref:Uncharacterized protein n=1 Tax=Fusarium mundagurra TaxID=1567541 RepID=A0A8H5Y2K3_9HYPO|nr:hypothetical protein FMUND_12859 [Fusarium mundagurra]
MACPDANITARLREAIANWNTHLQGIKDPDDVFRQERARISDASKKRIEEFYLNTLRDNDNNNNNNNDNVALLLRTLLSDGQQIKELEMEHEVTRTKKQELQDEVAKSVGRRIVADVIGILGLSAEQHLMPAVPPTSEEATSTTKNYVDSASLPVPDDSDAPEAAMGLTTRSRSYNRRKNGGSRQKVAPSVGPSVSKGDSSLKRKRQADNDEPDMKQEKTPRASARQTPSSLGSANFDSVRSLPAPCTRSGDLLQHSNEEDVNSSRKAIESQYKNIRLDVSRPSARVMLRRHPVRRGLWACLIFVPPDQADMSFDTMVNRLIMPAFVQLADRRRRGNIREGQAALGNAQPPVNTGSSLNNTGEGEGEMEKGQFENTEGQ